MPNSAETPIAIQVETRLPLSAIGWMRERSAARSRAAARERS
ncbi:hypothetical protein [Streptosporangium canum]